MKPSKILSFLLLVVVLVLLAPRVATALPLDLERFQGAHPVIVIFARDDDEPRAFSFNLALSTEWDRIEARGIETVDVGPGRYDLDAVAIQLGIEDWAFAVVLVGLDGTILHRTSDPGALSQILMILDQELHRDNRSLSS